MRVSELRQVLDRHGVDHSHCLEKSELVQMVKRIEEKRPEEKTPGLCTNSKFLTC